MASEFPTLADVVGIVTFEETGIQRVVRAFCENCQRSVSQGNHTRRMTTIDEVTIVSPSGIAHAQHELHSERTACGLDATGVMWWWRL